MPAGRVDDDAVGAGAGLHLGDHGERGGVDDGHGGAGGVFGAIAAEGRVAYAGMKPADWSHAFATTSRSFLPTATS